MRNSRSKPIPVSDLPISTLLYFSPLGGIWIQAAQGKILSLNFDQPVYESLPNKDFDDLEMIYLVEEIDPEIARSFRDPVMAEDQVLSEEQLSEIHRMEEGSVFETESLIYLQDADVFETMKEWLEQYFDGTEPDFTPPVHLIGTPFQKEVWEILTTIPYGQTTTYGKVAKILAAKRNVPQISPQAVGQAVGRNPISILIPCHRVTGTKGLVGYAGGLDRKKYLLELEMSGLFSSGKLPGELDF